MKPKDGLFHRIVLSHYACIVFASIVLRRGGRSRPTRNLAPRTASCSSKTASETTYRENKSRRASKLPELAELEGLYAKDGRK